LQKAQARIKTSNIGKAGHTEKKSLPKTPMVGGGGRSRRTAFVTGGGLGAFLLAIASVP
jgi:hypothetical protein